MLLTGAISFDNLQFNRANPNDSLSELQDSLEKLTNVLEGFSNR
jgi:hypothetical protein